MRASLADQPGLAVALGANLPSPAGEPIDTLVAVRPQLEALLGRWVGPGPEPRCHWSPLFATAPVGGPSDQPDYCNAVVLIEAMAPGPEPSLAAAEALLRALHQLEQGFGRQRRERWGPRSLDLDLLWWGPLRQDGAGLELPHPRWRERGFVLAPLRAIERRLGRPLRLPAPALAGVPAPPPGPLPQPLPPRSDWPE